MLTYLLTYFVRCYLNSRHPTHVGSMIIFALYLKEFVSTLYVRLVCESMSSMEVGNNLANETKQSKLEQKEDYTQQMADAYLV